MDNVLGAGYASFPPGIPSEMVSCYSWLFRKLVQHQAQPERKVRLYPHGSLCAKPAEPATAAALRIRCHYGQDWKPSSLSPHYRSLLPLAKGWCEGPWAPLGVHIQALVPPFLQCREKLTSVAPGLLLCTVCPMCCDSHGRGSCHLGSVLSQRLLGEPARTTQKCMESWIKDWPTGDERWWINPSLSSHRWTVLRCNNSCSLSAAVLKDCAITNAGYKSLATSGMYPFAFSLLPGLPHSLFPSQFFL